MYYANMPPNNPNKNKYENAIPDLAFVKIVDATPLVQFSDWGFCWSSAEEFT